LLQELRPLPHATSADLFALFDRLGIRATAYSHIPVFTVAESQAIKETIPGGHSKNLFLKDKKGRMFLVVAEAQTPIDLKRLHETIGASGRLSFGSAGLLRDVLGVEPGSVTPFALMNDTAGQVSVILDAALMEHEPVNFHPLVNSKTTGVSREDLMTFLRATGHEPRVLRLPAPAEICETADLNPS
jgi:Ala-tRNA(Pro) deacylase